MRQPHSILVIDDCEDDRDVYRRLLKSDEEYLWTVFDAETGEEGMEIYGTRPVNCVLLDFSLPGKNGLAVLVELKQMDRFIPVVMLTGLGDVSTAVEAMQNGAQDYLAKNEMTAEALHRAVHNAVHLMAFARKIDQQQSELESFANVLAHDLKEPARSISYLLEYLKKEISGNLSQKSEKYMSLIGDASSRMIQLIDAVSAYSFLDRSVPAHEKFPLEEAVKNAVSNLDAVISKRNAEVTWDTLPEVTGDMVQLAQLLQNLIGNGLKYCEQEVPKVHISSEQKADVWVISVKDNGIGMKAEYLKKVFEAFKRLHSASEYEGTGLGLATCRKVVERHGGEIWCESTEGEGSTFLFTLPVEGVQQNDSSQRDDAEDRRTA